MGRITSRYFTPDKAHPAHAVTGAFCVGTAARMPGTIAHDVAAAGAPDDCQVVVEHPSGTLDFELQLITAPKFDVISATVTRTARKLMSGSVFIPREVWEGK